MPRHISIAKFYDWTDDLYDCVSVSKSKLHENMNDTPRRFSEKSKLQNTRWCSNGVHVTPGRMFSRERGNLTKGEVNIIHGIYQNRGNLSETDTLSSPRSHKDAWLVGKTTRNSSGNQTERVDSVSSHDTDLSDGRASGKSRAGRHTQGCGVQKDTVGPATINLFFSNGVRRRASGKTLEKTTCVEDRCEMDDESHQNNSQVDRTTPRTQRLPADKEDSTSGDGFVRDHEDQNMPSSSEVNTMNGGQSVSYRAEESSKEVDSKRQVTRRIQMEVFLPPVPRDPTDDDIRNSLQEGRPLLERERPMSHTKFKLKLDRLPETSDPYNVRSDEKNNLAESDLL
ncbi:uncharacterized protein LOC121372162 [Gigantopelta aegis]|uniref:uncharacterized protein LOC121372162 n=1 Tax=Gigantopelta aegis TaxID=1735272 RepID=UPI001B8898BF|nr:uncharacterized protein LOC121372162 [Gigantopelta aegis]